VPDWNEYVASIKNESLFWHNMCKNCGCPRSGMVVDIMRRTRVSFHYFIINQRLVRSSSLLLLVFFRTTIETSALRLSKWKIVIQRSVELLMVLLTITQIWSHAPVIVQFFLWRWQNGNYQGRYQLSELLQSGLCYKFWWCWCSSRT